MEVCNCKRLSAVITARQSFGAKITPKKVITAELKLPTVIQKVAPNIYTGETVFIPSWREQRAETANTLVLDDITIKPIQTYETSNEAGGITFII